MPSRYRLGRLINDVTVVHVPTTPPDELLAVPPLAPFALVPGGAAVAPQVVEVIAGTRDREVVQAMSALAVDLADGFRDTVIALLRRSSMIYPVEEVWADIEHTWLGDAVREHVGKIMLPDLQAQLLPELRAKVTAEVTAEAVREVLRARFPGADDEMVREAAARLVRQHSEHAAGVAALLTDLGATPTPGA
jgi:hypothetical protein